MERCFRRLRIARVGLTLAVAEVANGIEVLPASRIDDRIRWETFYRIFADPDAALRWRHPRA
jgi:hypothetical protein